MAGQEARPLLRGKMVLLRPAERDDIPIFVRWLSDERTTRFLSLRAPIGIAMEERWFERMQEGHGRDSWFFVVCRLDDRFPVGSVSLFDLDHVNGSAGLGILIGEVEFQGRGFGSDALAVLLDFAFGELRLERVWLDVYDFNARAIRSFEKNGFVHEGRQRRARYQRGRYYDVLRMAILRDEWAALERPRGWELDGEREEVGEAATGQPVQPGGVGGQPGGGQPGGERGDLGGASGGG